jgi:hypothetical protein
MPQKGSFSLSEIETPDDSKAKGAFSVSDIEAKTKPYQSPVYPGGPSSRTPTEVMQDQAAEVLKGIPEAITGIPGTLKAIGSAAYDALTGNAKGVQDAVVGAVQSAAKPATVSLRGLGAAAFPSTFQAPSREDFEGAARGAGAMLGSAELSNVVSAPPVQSAARAAGNAVADAAGKAAPSIAESLRESAKGNWERVLGPTKERTKVLTEKVAGDLADRGVTALTEKSLKGKVQSMLQSAGQDVDKAWADLPEGAALPKQPILDAIDKVRGQFVADGVDVLPEATSKLADLRKIVDEFGDQIPADALRKTRQVWDMIVNKAGGYAGADLSATAKSFAQKQVANAIREEIGNAYPDIKTLNAEFNFWSNVDEVLSAKTLRERGRNLTMRDLVAGGTGGTAGTVAAGPIGGAIGGVLAPAVTRFMQSTAWRTTSAALKSKIANLIDKGKFAEAAETIPASRQLPAASGETVLPSSGQTFAMPANIGLRNMNDLQAFLDQEKAMGRSSVMPTRPSMLPASEPPVIDVTPTKITPVPFNMPGSPMSLRKLLTIGNPRQTTSLRPGPSASPSAAPEAATIAQPQTLKDLLELGERKIIRDKAGKVLRIED